MYLPLSSTCLTTWMCPPPLLGACLVLGPIEPSCGEDAASILSIAAEAALLELREDEVPVACCCTSGPLQGSPPSPGRRPLYVYQPFHHRGSRFGVVVVGTQDSSDHPDQGSLPPPPWAPPPQLSRYPSAAPVNPEVKLTPGALPPSPSGTFNDSPVAPGKNCGHRVR